MVPSGYEGIMTIACLRIIDFSVCQYVKQVWALLTLRDEKQAHVGIRLYVCSLLVRNPCK